MPPSSTSLVCQQLAFSTAKHEVAFLDLFMLSLYTVRYLSRVKLIMIPAKTGILDHIQVKPVKRLEI